MDSWRVFDFNCAAPRVTQVLNKNIGTCVQTHSHRLTWTLHYSLGLVLFFKQTKYCNHINIKVVTTTLHRLQLDANHAPLK